MASLSDQLSVISQGLSAQSQNISVHSNLISNAISARAVISQQVSVLSQAISVISAGLGGVQKRMVTGAQVISATALTNISGLSISVASAATYELNGRVLFTLSTLTGTKFGFTWPAAITPGSMMMECLTTVLVAGPANLVSTNYAVGRIADAQMSTVGTVQISLLGGASGTTHQLEIYGLFKTGANAGTVQLQAAQSATGGGVQILAGSFLRAYKVT